MPLLCQTARSSGSSTFSQQSSPSSLHLRLFFKKIPTSTAFVSSFSFLILWLDLKFYPFFCLSFFFMKLTIYFVLSIRNLIRSALILWLADSRLDARFPHHYYYNTECFTLSGCMKLWDRVANHCEFYSSLSLQDFLSKTIT